MVYFRKKKAEYLLAKIQVQSTIDPSNTDIVDMWDDYTQTAFPFVEGSKKQEVDTIQKTMAKAAADGPFVIKLSEAIEKMPSKKRNK